MPCIAHEIIQQKEAHKINFKLTPITLRVRLICKTVSTEQNSTGQNKTEQGKIGQEEIAPVREIEIIFFIFENKMGIFVFFIVVPWTKSCPVV
jgi:hypothetical protein